jgi:hypothetical protein
MRAHRLCLLLLAALAAGPGCSQSSLPGQGDPFHLIDAGADLGIDAGGDLAPDPCGPRAGSGYSCAYLIGSCPTPGLSCLCWERGTRVCQKDLLWELILDNSRCPEIFGGSSYEGKGCLGGNAICGTCVCSDVDKQYHCPKDLGVRG